MTEDERVADKAALLYLLLQEVQVSFVLAKNKQVVIAAYLFFLYLLLRQVWRTFYFTFKEIHKGITLKGGIVLKLLVINCAYAHTVKQVEAGFKLKVANQFVYCGFVKGNF